MIIQIRGTSGSGKTTVMREVMDLMGDWNAKIVEGRKKPLYYRSCSDWPDTVVLGHYEESACGGCDTIGSAPKVVDLIQEVKAKVILCEGLLLSEDVKWAKQMEDLHVVFLTTSLEECLRRITKRRKDAGNDKPLNPKNTTNRIKVIKRSRLKLIEEGVLCKRASSVQAPQVILRWIRAQT